MDLEQAKAELEKMAPEFAQTVAPIYKLLNWEWESASTGQRYVPDVEDIVANLFALIEDLKEDNVCGSAGLEVYFELPTEEEPGHYGINFLLQRDITF